ncbi:MAG TPA: HAD-IA family hydrolase [Candidatus Acidoferrales bacterium]|nr:HAD-IA family hydrolase [Candidatus Acidoferrales bacterium]
MPLKLICFDAAGTLFDTGRPVGEIYAEFARRYGMAVSSADLRRRFRGCFASSPPLAFPDAPPDTIAELEFNWWKDLVRRIFEPYGRFEKFNEYFAALFEHFRQPATWVLYPETARTLAALKGAGFSLAVITNFDSRVLGILEGLGIASYFDSAFLSSRVGHAKPDPEIFRRALGRYAAAPGEAIHIGDSPSHDAAGAKAAGLNAVLIDRSGKHRADGYLRIESLDEVLALIERLR